MIHSCEYSIIIPVYNQKESLLITLSLFEKQNYPSDKFELIIVNDGSTDELEVDITHKEWPRNFKFIHQTNKGRACARNIGVENARSNNLIFCDADRFPDPDYITSIANVRNHYGDCAIIGRPLEFFGSKKWLDLSVELDWNKIKKYSRDSVYYHKITQLYDHRGFTDSPIRWSSFLVGNSCVTRRDFELVNGFDPDFKAWGFEHFEFALRLQDKGVFFYSCSDAINFHIPHPREQSFYRTMIEQSMDIVERKHPTVPCRLLKDFMFGEITLQRFEYMFGGFNTETLMQREPITMTIK
ncbi:hypothetical protein GCM10008014_30360 [Paenibacillus silvae]|uniref:Glycosyltransferase family 2 protein n=1 Tax=Paenibacillus silvae TaxID=1325358 RepID=A0ABQ1ZES4_9BACL|nr:glycosyltransferase family 2 protein [Paenibacillus silvae]GGH58087.1 hypothetical protein GCM10008014_30360 [Paenibacillus silvae]